MGEGNFKKNLAAFAIGLAVSCGVVGLTHIWIQHEPRKPESQAQAIPMPSLSQTAKQMAPGKGTAGQMSAEEDTGPLKMPYTDKAKVKEIVEAQYATYSKEAEEYRASEKSKYDIYPPEEELQRLRKDNLLMY